MTDLLASLFALALIVVLGCGLFALAVVVPFVRGVDMAERRGFSADRWGAVCLVGVAVGLAAAYAVHSAALSRLLYLPAVALMWSGPVLLSLLAPGQRIGGPQGAHEH